MYATMMMTEYSLNMLKKHADSNEVTKNTLVNSCKSGSVIKLYLHIVSNYSFGLHSII